MADITGYMKKYTVTDQQGNTYTLDPVDTEARQEIEEAKNLQFDSSFFTAEEDNVNGEVNIGLNGVPIGVDETLRFVQDSQNGIVIGINSDVSDAGKVLAVDNTGKAVWDDAPEELPASTSSDEGKVLAVDDQGTPVWKSFDSDVVGTQLLDEHDQPVLDEESTPGNPIYVYDAGASTDLWTGFSGKGFGAIRTYADQDGNNIKATYARKDDVSILDEATEGDVDSIVITYGSVVIDGRTYKTVTIGNQEWLAENLDYKFEGLEISDAESSSDAIANYYDGDEATYGRYGNRYGLLYNWTAVDYIEQNKATILPSDWHVPTATEWDTLATAVGGASVAGEKLKSFGGWSSGNGDDPYGMSIYPAGRKAVDYDYINTMAYFWSATEHETATSNAYYYLFATSDDMTTYYTNKEVGLSVRLVRTIS